MCSCGNSLRVVIISGLDDPARAVAGFAFAVAAVAGGVSVDVWLMMRGAAWAVRSQGHQRDVPGFESVKTYMNTLLESGGTVSICSNCVSDACLLQGVDGAPEEIHAQIRTLGLATVAAESVSTSTVVF